REPALRFATAGAFAAALAESLAGRWPEGVKRPDPSLPTVAATPSPTITPPAPSIAPAPAISPPEPGMLASATFPAPPPYIPSPINLGSASAPRVMPSPVATPKPRRRGCSSLAAVSLVLALIIVSVAGFAYFSRFGGHSSGPAQGGNPNGSQGFGTLSTP